MRNNKFAQYLNRLELGTLVIALVTTIGGAVLPTTASAQDKKDEISFDLVANRRLSAARKSSHPEQSDAVTGKPNDTLILDLTDLQTLVWPSTPRGGATQPVSVRQRSIRLKATSKKRSFGLAWHQSDIQIGKNIDDGHARSRHPA